jgi:hypothetical protein
MKIGSGFYVSGNAQAVTMGFLHDRRKNRRIETFPTVVCFVVLALCILFRIEQVGLDEIRVAGFDNRPLVFKISRVVDDVIKTSLAIIRLEAALRRHNLNRVTARTSA